MLGPLLFGFVIDHSCLLWETKCDDRTGACLYYDTHQMAWLLMAVCVACQVLNIVCGFISWRLYERKYDSKDEQSQSRDENTPSVGLTGSSETGNSYKSTVGGNSGDVPFAIDNPTTQADSHDADVGL